MKKLAKTEESGKPTATHSICQLVELATTRELCRSEDKPKYGQNVFTKMLAEEVKITPL
jgi:hypothetical protein